jgi:hypothetical protein
VVCALLPFSDLNLINRGVTSSAVHISDELRFEESDEVGFVCGGSQQ